MSITTNESIYELIQVTKNNHSKFDDLMLKVSEVATAGSLKDLKIIFEKIQELIPQVEQKGDVLYYRKLMEVMIHFFSSETTLAKGKLKIILKKNWKNKNLQGVACLYYAGCFRNNGEYDQAIFYLNKCNELIDPECEAVTNLVVCYFQLGEIHCLINELAQAEQYFLTGLEIGMKDNRKTGLFRILSGLATLYRTQEKFSECEQYLEYATEYSNSAGEKSRVLYDYAIYYEQIGDLEKSHQKALESYQIRIDANLIDASTTSLILIAKIKIREGALDKGIAILEENLPLTLKYNSVAKTKDIYEFLSNAYKQKEEWKLAFEYFEKYEEIKSSLFDVKQQEIFKIKIAKQQETIKIIHDRIESSIRYAKQIQKAILPSKSLLSQCFIDNFVFFKPKAIVSGDFYWVEQVENLTVFAVADCTGHGIPGAMVSIVCHNALKQAIKEMDSPFPGLILDRTRDLVLETFTKSENEITDGMDISLCVLDKGNKELYFSGANNNLYLIRNNELIEFKADRQPIGKYDRPTPFKSHHISLEEQDAIYIFSDGYVDQFGGPKEKKYMHKPFKKLLLTIQDLPMQEQKEHIANVFDMWKGDFDQIDDVCVLGVKI